MPFSGKNLSLSEIKQYSFDLLNLIKQQSISDGTEHFIPLPKLEMALEQFFELSEKIETEPELLKSGDSDFSSISELGDYGLQLLAGLEHWFDKTDLDNKSELQMATLSLALWIHDQGGVLQQLESCVNALSQLANLTNDKSVLIKLHKYAEKITNSAHEIIKADVDKSEAGRAWRILNLNHGIIATRTHDIEIMNSVFEQLLQRLPEDAVNFFSEGMKQMDIIDYPDHVRHVIEQFYQLTNKPTLH